MVTASTSSAPPTAKRVPVSIEALLAQQRSEKDAQARPKFLTRAQREALAREKEDEVKKRQTGKVEESQRRREEFEASVKAVSSSGQRDNRYDDRRRGNYNGQSNTSSSNAPTGPRAMRDGGRNDANPSHARQHDNRPSYRNNTNGNANGASTSSNGTAPSASTSALNAGDSANTDMPVYDLAAVKARYLGDKSGQAKRKIRKQSDKKFVFDWDKAEDTATAHEVDPLYRALRAGDSAAAIAQYRKPMQDTNGGKIAEIDNDETDVALAGPKALTTGKSRLNAVLDERHWTEKTLDEMKERDWRIFREDFSIAARGGSIPLPMRYWHESAIPDQLQDIIASVGYEQPSAIQRQAIPIGLNVRDMIGIAETGSGKTAAFVIPMLAYISRLPPLSDANRHMGPYALIIAPTRELAQQIETETKKFTDRLGYTCVSIVGGRNMEEQSLSMRNGAEIIIATPGRLKDCIERSVVVFSQCTYVVMDEADRMISLGFEDVINFILDTLPVSNLKPDTEEAEDASKMLQKLIGGEDGAPLADVYMYRQTMMFSATMPPACERLARKYLRRPAIVTIGVAGQAVDRVEQRVEFITGDDKRKARMLDIMANEGFAPPIIVFIRTKKEADVVARDISRAGWRATTLHSGKTQEQREAALRELRAGDADVLVATDLAGRGIDVQDVSLVINFHMAGSIESYVHRIGRTGRAGKLGVAVTFLSDADADVMYDLKQEISKSPVSKVPQELSKHEAAQSKMSWAMKRKADDMD